MSQILTVKTNKQITTLQLISCTHFKCCLVAFTKEHHIFQVSLLGIEKNVGMQYNMGSTI